MSSGIVIIIKNSETRQYTLLFAGCEKIVSFYYFLLRRGRALTVNYNQRSYRDGVLFTRLAKVACFDAQATTIQLPFSRIVGRFILFVFFLI